MESLSGERRSPDTMAPALVGIIGGSALGDAFDLEQEQARFLVTPHGAPSDPPRVGMHGGVQVAFLPRHGKDHRIPPHKLNHRANLWALKEVGATYVIGTSSTGSLKKAIRPGSFVVPDDVVGMTMASEATLASELGIPYASLCTVDNFAHGIVDEPLTFETIRETQRANAALTRTVVAGALGRLR